MPNVTISNSKGVVQQAGSGLNVGGNAAFAAALEVTGSVSLTAMPISTVQARTFNGAVTAPGVYTMSGSSGTGILNATMPTADSVPGGIFVFRAASADAHFLTGSAEAQGTRVFKSVITGSELQTVGSKLALSPAIGNSVALISDGKNFLVMNSSGSLSFSGT